MRTLTTLKNRSSQPFDLESLFIAIKGDPVKLPGAVRLPTIDEQPLASLSHLPAILDQCVSATRQRTLSGGNSLFCVQPPFRLGLPTPREILPIGSFQCG